MMRRHRLATLALGLTFGAGGIALAQTPAPARLRATIDSVTATTLTVSLRDGSPTTVQLPSAVRVSGITVAKIGDIKPGSYIGTAATPQPDGSNRGKTPGSGAFFVCVGSEQSDSSYV